MAEANAPDGMSYAWIRGLLATPWLGVAAVVGYGNEEEAEPAGHGNDAGGEEWVCLSVTNMHEEKDLSVHVEAGAIGKEVKVYQVGGDSKGWKATNTFMKQEVRMTESVWKRDGETEFVFPKMSLTLLRWRV